MCLFNFPNKASKKAFLKGVEEFECGHCPECLQKKSRQWALRCGMEAKTTQGIMVTLTYDTYKIVNGVESSISENPTNPNIALSKRDCQLFIKRLRKHFKGEKVSYLLTAERGKRTNRAHYHALLFGVYFDDLVKYKMSDRGNWIYKSKTLTKIWKNGICTVDCINLSAKTARYCTKYCSKDSGMDDTFMLFSRGIGEKQMLKEFNGKSYWIDGREYSIPKQIWSKVIEKRYKCKGYSKYINHEHVEQVEKWTYNQFKKIFKKAMMNPRYPTRLMRDKVINKAVRRMQTSDERYNYQAFKREIFESYRDNDKQYKAYLAYWKEKNRVAEITRPTVEERILALPNNKYRSYKNKAIEAKHNQYKHKKFIPPRSNCGYFAGVSLKPVFIEKAFAPFACHYRANDTKSGAWQEFKRLVKYLKRDNMLNFKKEVERVKKIIQFNPLLVL